MSFSSHQARRLRTAPATNCTCMTTERGGSFGHSSRNHVDQIRLDELLKPAHSLPTQHELVELLMLSRMLEQTHKVGRGTIDGKCAGGHMLFCCYQFIIHPPDALFKQGILILIMHIEGGAMNHSSFADLSDRNLLEGAISQFR